MLEAVRAGDGVPRASINVTTDKVYENHEWDAATARTSRWAATTPTSSSKACAELVTAAYRDSFFAPSAPTAVATARAGNVIGGGDWGRTGWCPT